MLRFLTCLFFLGVYGLSLAEPVVFHQEEQINLGSELHYLEDPEGKLTLKEVQSPDTNWEINSQDVFSRGYSRSAWWLRVTLVNANDSPQRRFLEIAYALLDQVDVYVVAGQSLINQFSLGDRYPFAKRLVDSRNFVIPLEWSPQQTLVVYLRVDTSSSVQLPLTLWQTDALSINEANVNIAQGLYFGAMLVIVIYNLLLFLVLWDRSYLYYVGFVASMPLLAAAMTGQGFRYLWPGHVGWNEYVVAASIASTVIFANLFAGRFLSLKRHAPVLNLVAKLNVTLGIGGGVLAFTLPYYTAIALLTPLGLVSSLSGLIMGIVCWWRQIPLARYFCIAWVTFLTGAIAFNLTRYNILPTNWLTEHALQIGSILEAVLLSFALAERINVERKLRLSAQEETIDTVRRLNAELENRVQERTQELKSLNDKLQALSNTDQLTTLANRRLLETSLAEAWENGAKNRQPLAVILLDIDHFKAVNDTYGHPTGDACLKVIAATIRSCIHEATDLLARYGGEEFCLLLPNTDGKGAMSVAERIRETVAEREVISDEHRLFVTISLGVCVEVPNPRESAETILRHADTALYESKQMGRNRATLFRQNDNDNDKVTPLPLPRGSGL